MTFRLVIFTANYNHPNPFDAYRQGLFQEFAKKGIETLVVQTTDFFSDVTNDQFLPNAASIVIEKLKAFSPSAILFINAGGRIREIQDYIEKAQLPSLTWFWDHPGIHHSDLIQPRVRHVFASANWTFIRWLQTEKKLNETFFVPFPSIEIQGALENLSEDTWKKRPISSVFMGSIWKPDQLINRIFAFTDQKIEKLNIKEFLLEVEKDSQTLNEGRKAADLSSEFLKRFRLSFGGERAYLHEVNDYFSTQDRLEYLRALSPLGLQLFGYLPSWIKLIYSTAPELGQAFQHKNISDPDELIRVCQSAKVGLNIFHRQNQGGGTNFRFNEYAMAGTPILSNRNTECERVFPHQEAALYYSNTNELLDNYRELMDNPKLAVQLIRRTHEIAREYSGISKVVSQLLEKMGHSKAAGSSTIKDSRELQFLKRESIQVNHNPNDQFSRSSPVVRIRSILKQHGFIFLIIKSLSFSLRKIDLIFHRLLNILIIKLDKLGSLLQNKST